MILSAKPHYCPHGRVITYELVSDGNPETDHMPTIGHCHECCHDCQCIDLSTPEEA